MPTEGAAHTAAAIRCDAMQLLRRNEWLDGGAKHTALAKLWQMRVEVGLAKADWPAKAGSAEDEARPRQYS